MPLLFPHHSSSRTNKRDFVSEPGINYRCSRISVSGPGFPIGVGYPTSPRRSHPLPGQTYVSSPTISKPTNTDPILEPDEFGAELGKDARVWKVYVKESDAYDGELVDGWNKSLDVILVFAALFSAISTAFIIESSGKLEQDPTDVSAQTLLDISRTLQALVNTGQPNGSDPPSNVTSPSFAPPRSIVIVNTLWYLSLSLSVATSFLAMMAKDWCHSFMAGRTGHPYNQTMLRQQKWMMVEKWRMQELIRILPSIIHLALFLFAVGLCFYIWSINSRVSIPVICVTGAAFGFYIWSSITASFVEYFPYTTAVSRFFWSDWGRWLSSQVRSPFQSSYSLAVYVASSRRYLSPIAHSICQALRGWRSYVFNLMKFFVARSLHRCLGVIGNIHWVRSLAERFHIRHWTEFFDLWARDYEEALHRNQSPPESRSVGPIDGVIPFALQWLITSCEAPTGVEAALQAIAGAGPRTPRAPLEKCGAALEISKRLVSGNTYKAADQRPLSLYVRALSFLGSKDTPGTTTQSTIASAGELQVIIWDLQTQYEVEVAKLIADGKFTPSDENLKALRIGSNTASHTLRLLSGFEQSESDASLPEFILRSLEDHCAQRSSLHPAALKSLLNASELLSICVTDCRMTLRVIDQLMILAHGSSRLSSDSGNPQKATEDDALHCAYILAQNLSESRGDTTSRLSSSPLEFAGRMKGHITKNRDTPRSDQMMKILREVLEVRTRPDLYSVSEPFNNLQRVVSQNEDPDSQQRCDSFSETRVDEHRFYRAIPCYLRQLEAAPRQILIATQPSQIYLFVAEIMFSTTSDQLRNNCARLLHKLPFPNLSMQLVESLEKYDLVPLLERNVTSTSRELQIFAISLLWLLCALETYALPDAEPIRNRLGDQLRRCTVWGDPNVMKQALGTQLLPLWQAQGEPKSMHEIARRPTSEQYLSRIIECVIEAGTTSHHTLR